LNYTEDADLKYYRGHVLIRVNPKIDRRENASRSLDEGFKKGIPKPVSDVVDGMDFALPETLVPMLT